MIVVPNILADENMNTPEYRLTTAGYSVSFVEIWRYTDERNGQTEVRYCKNGLKVYEEWQIRIR